MPKDLDQLNNLRVIFTVCCFAVFCITVVYTFAWPVLTHVLPVSHILFAKNKFRYNYRGVYITDSVLVNLGVRSSLAIGNNELVVTRN